MAFGFSPKHVKEYDIENLDHNYFLVLAIEAALKLKWNVGFVSETGFIAYTMFSWASWGEEISIKIKDNKVYVKSEITGLQLIDWGKNKKNIEKLFLTIEDLKKVLTKEDIESKRIELKQKYFSKEKNSLNKPVSTTKSKITDFPSIFKPTDGYFATPILISLNTLIFLVMVTSGVNILLPEKQSIINWGANFGPLTLDGQWWRLFTACFIHIGIFHLLMNMYALLFIGLLLEPYLGKTRFFAAYLIAGIAASVTSLWWNNFTMISAGASGAIFGMYGVFLALLTTNLLDKSIKKPLLISIAVFVGYNILNGFKPNSGIDNAGHIGGLITGLIIGYAFIPSLKHDENTGIKFSTIGILTTVLLVSSVLIYKSLPNDFAIYETKLKKFAEIESMALEVYHLPKGTPNKVILSELKDRGIYYWNEDLKLVNSFEKLNLPRGIREKNRLLKKYCELRLKNYKLIYKAIKENTDRYTNQINKYNQKIEAIIKELTARP